jgi:hypothetical protein
MLVILLFFMHHDKLGMDIEVELAYTIRRDLFQGIIHGVYILRLCKTMKY